MGTLNELAPRTIPACVEFKQVPSLCSDIDGTRCCMRPVLVLDVLPNYQTMEAEESPNVFRVYKGRTGCLRWNKWSNPTTVEPLISVVSIST